MYYSSYINLNIFNKDKDKKMIFNYNNAIPTNFKLTFPELPELEYYALSTNVPTTTLNPIEVPFRDVSAKIPDNRYHWDDITVQLIMDENLYAYEIMKQWQYDIREEGMWQNGLKDINLIPLDSNKNIEYSFKFHGAWPNMVGGWQYTSNASTSDIISFDVTFSYQHFEIVRIKPIDFKIVTRG